MKEFITYDEQIEKLKQKGLTIDDEAFARSFLKKEGYFNVINGYSPIFKLNKQFYTGTTFEDICALYAFDKALRSIIYKHTSTIETHIKALIAHEFSRVHGVDETKYLTPECFSANQRLEENVARLISECNDTITEALNENSNRYRKYITHNKNAHGHVPLWVLMRALSFGTTAIFYKSMITEEKKIIAEEYGISAAQLTNMLEVVVPYRNIVAHSERTYCARLPKARLSTNLSITRKLQIPKNHKGENKFGRNDLLALLICCKYLLPKDDFNKLYEELSELLADLEARLNPSIVGKIKISMGLSTKSWKTLPKLVIEEHS